MARKQAGIQESRMWLCMDCARRYPHLGAIEAQTKGMCEACGQSKIVRRFEQDRPVSETQQVSALGRRQTWQRALMFPLERLASGFRAWLASLRFFYVLLSVLNLLAAAGLWVYGNAILAQYPAQVTG